MTGETRAARWSAETDVLIIGSGVAGLSTAVRARELGLRVLVVTKADAQAGSTAYAQGGVAVVLPGEHEPGDCCARHVADTRTAGAGLCADWATEQIIAAGPAAVLDLQHRGAKFDRGADGHLARTREGGHGTFRVVHSGGDATGAEVARALLAAARDGGVPILTGHTAVDALRTGSGAIGGLSVLDDAGVPGVLSAAAVVVATGGIGQLYRATTNPSVSTGDGLALALRAGARIADVEFVQFHPTVLYTGSEAVGQRPLITEAVRGEGAVLLDVHGAPVMRGVHPLGDLAPRDVVAAAITKRMRGTASEHVYLDARGIGADRFARRFPTVHAACLAAGIDPGNEGIPVAPAAHFGCGGVCTSVQGRTEIPGLYAVGEVARTGLHGANRLASNSLLEGLVLGRATAEAIAADLRAGMIGMLGDLEGAALPAARMADRNALQGLMSTHAAIPRSESGLRTAIAALRSGSVVRPLWTPRAVEDAALTLVADTLLRVALLREESRGAHIRLDHPERDDQRWRRSIPVRLDVAGRPILGEVRGRDAAGVTGAA